MPVAPSEAFLTKKAGPLPVWAWGGIGLGGAFVYSKWKANSAAAQGNGTTSTTDAAGESTAAAPQFIIENQEAAGPSASATVNVTNPAPIPVTTPPGTTTTPPTTTPPVLQGGNPPVGPVGPVKTPTPAPAKPVTPVKKAPIAYKVQHGDTLSSIAAKYHTTWQTLWSYNTGSSSPHSAAAKATLLKQGSNLIYAGQTIYIPQ